MKTRRFISASMASGALVLTMAGLAGASLADSSCSLSNTGADSHNSCSIENENHVTITNNPTITVTNNNDQDAHSGDAKVDDSTGGGSATTGNATNNNETTTTINISAPGQGGSGNGGGGGGQGGGGNQGGGGSGSGGSGSSSGSQSNAGSGSATTASSVSTLPDTGPAGVIDVSGLRNALSNVAADAQSGNHGLSALLLTVAAVLCLTGAAASAIYASKRS